MEDKNQEEKKVCKGFQLLHTLCYGQRVCSECVCVCVFVLREGRHVMISISFCVLADLPKLMGFVSARKGEREEMQDAHVLLPELTVTNLPSQV